MVVSYQKQFIPLVILLVVFYRCISFLRTIENPRRVSLVTANNIHGKMKRKYINEKTIIIYFIMH